MSVHFIHIGKTGGSAIKWALRRSGAPGTPFGSLELHRHAFTIREVPADDHFFFFVRDPIARFMSGFYSRRNKGQPRYYYEWTKAERKAFQAFPTPQALAAGLAGEDPGQRARAVAAARAIRHTRPMTGFVGTPRELRRRADKLVYVGTLETLQDDWRQLREVLDVPRDLRLPKGPWRAHRQREPVDTSLDERGRRALEEWYAEDYKLVAYCEELRAERGWGSQPALTAGSARS